MFGVPKFIKGKPMSDKPNAQKLLMKPGNKIWLIHPPENSKEILGELPPNVTLLQHPEEPVDLILFFAASQKELEIHTRDLATHIQPGGLIWIAYNKGSSKIKTDINRDTLRAYAQTCGLLGVTLISLDDDWSAMRFRIAE